MDRARQAVGLPGPELLLAGPAQVLQLFADAIKTTLRGTRRIFVLGGHEVAMEIEDLTVSTGVGLAFGQFDDLRLVLKDLAWQGRRVSTLSIVGLNVHLRPGLVPTLISSPVTFGATVAVDDLASWVPDLVGRRIQLGIDDDGVASVHLRDRPRLGSVEIDVRVEGPFLVLDPTTLVAGTRRFGGLRRFPAFRLPLVTPHDVHVTEVSLESGALHVGGHLPELRYQLRVTDVQQFVRTLTPDLDRVVIPRG